MFKELQRILFPADSNKAAMHYLKNDDLSSYILDNIIQCVSQHKSIAIGANDDTIAQLEIYLNAWNIPFINANSIYKSEHFEQKNHPLAEDYVHNLIELRSWKKYLELAYDKIFGEWSSIDAIRIISEAKKNITPYPFVIQNLNFEFTPSEFYDFKKAIKNFIAYNRFYNQDGLKARVLKKYNKKKILSSDIQELNSDVRNYLHRLEEIKELILTGLHKFQKEEEYKLQKVWTEKIDQVRKKEIDIRSYILEYGADNVDKPSLLSFDQHKKNRYKKWNQLFNEENIDINPLQTLDDLKEETERLNNEFIQNQHQTTQGLKSINEINTNQADLKNSDQLLKELIKTINGIQIFSISIECNTKSYFKKLSFIENLIYDLQVFLQCNNVQAVIEWNNIEDTLPQSFTYFLEQLKSSPLDEWHDQFEYFYLSRMLDHVGFIREAYLNKAVDHSTFYLNIENLKNNWSKELCNKLLFETNQRIQSLKSNHKTLFKTWQQEGLNGVTLCEQGIFNQVYLTANLDEVHLEQFDECIIIDQPIVEGDKINAINKTEEYKPNIIPSCIEINETLQQTNLSQQLNLVKGLVYNLFPFLEITRAFQMKKANVLSIIHKHWQDDLAYSLIHLGKKEFPVNSIENLTDFFLSTDRPLIIIHQDGLLNPANDNIIYQLECMADLHKAGIKLININTIDLLHAKEDFFTNLWLANGIQNQTIVETPKEVV